MTPYRIMWICMAVIVFLLVVMLALDVCLYVSGSPTLSSTLQTYFGGSLKSWRAAIFGFIVCALLAHFTRWN